MILSLTAGYASDAREMLVGGALGFGGAIADSFPSADYEEKTVSAADSHPIFLEKNWTKVVSDDLYVSENGSELVYGVINFYRDPDGKYVFVERIYFGEVVVKKYYVKETIQTDQWIQIEKDGVWHTFKYPYGLQRKFILNQDKMITGVLIVLVDENGKEIIRREVKRK